MPPVSSTVTVATRRRLARAVRYRRRHGIRQRRRRPVVTAIVLIKTEVQRVPEIAAEIAQIPQVSEVYSVTGEFDLVAMVRVWAHEELADVIPGGVNKVPG